MQKCEHQHQSTWWFCQKNKMNKAVAQKLQSSRIVCFCVPSCHPPVEALALRYWHDGGEGGGLLSPAHTSHTYNIVYPPYPTHSPPCLSEGTASLQNMGTGKGFKHIYIYIYFKFVVSYLKIHQLGGSDTLWRVEVAKKHISQLMVADFLQVLRFNPDLDHQRRGWHTTDIKCYETFRAIWHRIYETFTTWNLWDTCRNSISTSVLNCSFLTPFDTIWGHLLGHPIIQHKTQKYLKTYRLI